MFDSAVLDVVVGLAFVYLLLSLICTSFSELIAQAFSTRAATLEKWVRQVFDDPSTLYGHPLVKALAGPNLSYGDTPPVSLTAKIRRAHLLPSYIPARTFALTLLGGLETANGLLSADQVSALPEPVRPLVTAAGNELNRARWNIEQWYDDAMQRVTGWYKRNAQLIVLVLAVLVAGALNADTIAMGRVLWRDDTIRETVVAQAEQAVQEVPPPAENSVEEAQADFEALDLPMGWGDLPDGGKAWLSKFLGLTITVLALSLGAPFWFDMLGKLVNLRGTGKLPKPEEESPAGPTTPPVIAVTLPASETTTPPTG